jgi:hypothetical protein
MDGKKESLDSLYSLLDAVELQTERLELDAKQLVNDFFGHHVNGNKKHKGDNSFLFCTCKVREDSIYLEWYYNFWKKGSTTRRFSKYIKKPKDKNEYTISTLLKHSAPWEHDEVRRTEHLFSLIRKQNESLTRIRRNLRDVIKNAEAYDAAIGDYREE